MSSDSWLTAAAGRMAAVFQDVETRGGPLPGGPVLVVANHPNSLLDPLLVFRVAGRTVRPLAKAPLFEQAVLGAVLRGLGGLPVYRRQDDAALMDRNDETFRRAIEALCAGDAVQIYPEGISHSGPGLAPLRTGAARIALGAEAAADWQLGLRIVPIGLTYDDKSVFRSRALASIGAPFTIDSLRDEWQRDPHVAVRTLTARIADAIEAQTLVLTAHEDRALIDAAERLYARERGLATWRESEPLAARLPRMQRFNDGLAWLRAHDPAEHIRLRRGVRRYHQRLALLGARDGDVPPEYRAGEVVAYLLRRVLPFLMMAPLALLGALLWYPPLWLGARLVVGVVRPEHEAVATYKLTGGFIAAPIALVLHSAIGMLLASGPGAALALVLSPFLGLIAIAGYRSGRHVREDAAVFIAAVARRRSRATMAQERTRLAAAFDRVLQRMDAAPAAPGNDVVRKL